MTHKGTYKREREAREHALKVKRYENDYETLLALHQAMSDYARIVEFLKEGLEGATLEELITLSAKISGLAVRVQDKKVGRSVFAYLDGAETYFAGRSTFEEFAQAYKAAVLQVGRAIRRDPFAP